MTQLSSSPVNSDKLKGQYIFLSASFPTVDRRAEFFETSNPFDITDAVVATANAVFERSGKLVFGGHPTISPLILSVGKDFLPNIHADHLPMVHIYQSEYFSSEIPKETKDLEQLGIAEIHMTDSVDEDRDLSLALMRKRMMHGEEIGSKPIAAILIGGMEGVYDYGSHFSEYFLFQEWCHGSPIYPIAKTGGASRILLNQLQSGHEPMNWEYNTTSLQELHDSSVYSILMRDVAADISHHL